MLAQKVLERPEQLGSVGHATLIESWTVSTCSRSLIDGDFLLIETAERHAEIMVVARIQRDFPVPDALELGRPLCVGGELMQQPLDEYASRIRYLVMRHE
jgi:hypothetical protein